MKTFSIIMNKQLVGKANSLKEAWEIAKHIDPKHTYDWEDIKDEYETARKMFDVQVQQGIKNEDDWDFRAWLNDKYEGDRIVEDTKLALQRHQEYAVKHGEITNDDIEQMLKGNMTVPTTQTEVPHTQIKFSTVWVIIHIILAICSGGVTIVAYTLPWVIAKYQTKDNCSGLGIAVFSWLYNIYRLAK